MKLAPQSFTKYGDKFTQVRRDGNVAIYERIHGGTGKRYWEVMVIRLASTSSYGVEAGDEVLPSSSHWGSLGWTFLSLEQAEEKAAKLNAKGGAA